MTLTVIPANFLDPVTGSVHTAYLLSGRPHVFCGIGLDDLEPDEGEEATCAECLVARDSWMATGQLPAAPVVTEAPAEPEPEDLVPVSGERAASLTVTLTDRRPVTIFRPHWPIVSQVRAETAEPERASVILTVRRHSSGRTLVFGVAHHNGRADVRRGRLLPSKGASWDLVATAINEVAHELLPPSWERDDLAARCIAKLPAERLG